MAKGEVDTFIELERAVYGFFEKDSGIITAMRHNGDEALFFSRCMGPTRWIPTEKFTADPKGMLSPDDWRKHMMGEDDYGHGREHD